MFMYNTQLEMWIGSENRILKINYLSNSRCTHRYNTKMGEMESSEINFLNAPKSKL